MDNQLHSNKFAWCTTCGYFSNSTTDSTISLKKRTVTKSVL